MLHNEQGKSVNILIANLKAPNRSKDNSNWRQQFQNVPYWVIICLNKDVEEGTTLCCVISVPVNELH